MTDWNIENNVICLSLADGNRFYPTAKDIFVQKNFDSYKYKEKHYKPLSDLNIRFSSLAARPIVRFEYNDKISLHLIVHFGNIFFEVGKIGSSFVDYIIINNVWKYIEYTSVLINKLLKARDINPTNLSYSHYAYLIQKLSNSSINIEDKVSKITETIKESTTPMTPIGLKAKLFPYQVGGSQWLDFMINQRCGCILGDEMGLGKTLQIITVIGLLKEKKTHIHCLVVCPISLLENWRREVEKFYPSLSTQIHYGPQRTGDYRILLESDIVIMPYSCSVSDAGMLTMIKWDLLVIDEAQNIKNPHTQRTKAIKSLKRDVPIAVTGTPFQNHMTDLWSLVDYILPGHLGNLNVFNQTYTDDEKSAIRLESILTPLMLRRKVSEVAKDLPERLDIPLPIKMTEEEASLYENCRNTENPMEELRNMHLSKIQKLRTFCTHPYVYNSCYYETDPITISNKYARLCEILEEIVEAKEKVVIFTSFTKMVDLLVTDLHKRFNVYTDFIDGRIEAMQRQLKIDKFSHVEGSAILILNPNAVGAGLNITCANHAIHYNLEWNPAVEDQASARVYRRGQKKKVFIYRLFYAYTIEEIINEKIQLKRHLSEKAVVGNIGNTDKEFLLKALKISPYKS